METAEMTRLETRNPKQLTHLAQACDVREPEGIVQEH